MARRVKCSNGGYVAPKATTTWTVPESTTKSSSSLSVHAEEVPAQLSNEQHAYWAKIDETFDLRPMDEEDSDDQEEDYRNVKLDALGIPLPAAPSAAAAADKEKESLLPKMSMAELFQKHVNLLDPAGRTPLGITDTTGLHLRIVLPSGSSGEKIAKLVPDMSVLIMVVTKRYGVHGERMGVASNILPCPVHVSPLMLLLMRSPGSCARYTDAIESYVRLEAFYQAVYELDTANPEHKSVCKRYKAQLMRTMRSTWRNTIDRLAVELQTKKTDRKATSDILIRYGDECVAYAHKLIHIVEWAICDMLRVPYVLRTSLMTPMVSGAQQQRISVHMLVEQGFPILRSNLCMYMRNRHNLFCSNYTIVDDNSSGKDKKKKNQPTVRAEGTAVDTHAPMNLDRPPIENRLGVLAVYDAKNGHPEILKDPGQYVFGLYHDWISLHTLREFLMYLSTEPEKEGAEGASAPAKRAPVYTEEQEMALAEQLSSMKMDEGE